MQIQHGLVILAVHASVAEFLSPVELLAPPYCEASVKVAKHRRLLLLLGWLLVHGVLVIQCVLLRTLWGLLLSLVPGGRPARRARLSRLVRVLAVRCVIGR